MKLPQITKIERISEAYHPQARAILPERWVVEVENTTLFGVELVRVTEETLGKAIGAARRLFAGCQGPAPGAVEAHHEPTETGA